MPGIKMHEKEGGKVKALVRYPKQYGLSRKQEKAMQAEVMRQLNENMSSDLEATFLWALHEEFGFGSERLRRFYNAVVNHRQQLVDHYEMSDDPEFILIRKLLEIGVDLKQWDKEQTQHLTVRV